MAVTHSTAARNLATDQVLSLIGTSGKLKFLTSPSNIGTLGSIAATLTLSATGFSSSGAQGYLGAGSQPATAGTAWVNAITSDTNAAGNASPVAYAAITTSAGTAVIHCAVAASASDINMSNGLTIANGDTVSCSNLSYTALGA